MKRFLVPALGAIAIAAMPASAAAQAAPSANTDSATKLVEARGIVEVIFPPAQRQQMFDKLLADMSGPLRGGSSLQRITDPGLKAIVDEMMDQAQAQIRPVIQRHLPEMLEALAVAYAHEFSLAELKDIRGFAQSPSGRHYLTHSLALVGDPAIVKANTQMVADARTASDAMTRTYTEKIITYVKAHPEVAAQLSNGADKK